MRTSFYPMILASTASAFTSNHIEYLTYIASYGRHFTNEEEYSQRLAQFTDRLERLEKINAENVNFTVGINKFSDWTQEEIKRINGWREPEGAYVSHPRLSFAIISEDSLPSEVNWTAAGKTTAVKD